MAYSVPGTMGWNKGWSSMAGKGWPGYAPPGACKPIFGPVGKVCNRATKFNQVYPTTVTSLQPYSTVSPVPSSVVPRTSFGKPFPVASYTGAPIWSGWGGQGAWDKGAWDKGAWDKGAWGKGGPGMGTWGKGAPDMGWYGKGGPEMGAWGMGAWGMGDDFGF